MTTRKRYEVGEYHEHVTRLGSELHPDDKVRVKARYKHRYTGDHKPAWAKDRADAKGVLRFVSENPFPLQFRDDADWLANTRFRVKDDGRLDRRAHYCESTPTWPFNPELRGK